VVSNVIAAQWRRHARTVNCVHGYINGQAVKAVESGTPRSERDRMILDLLSHLEALFARLPGLVGFSVLERATLAAHRESASLDAELSVADVAAHSWPGFEPAAPGQEIVAALVGLLEEHPSAPWRCCRRFSGKPRAPQMDAKTRVTATPTFP
jgi:hypothetical protein